MSGPGVGSPSPGLLPEPEAARVRFTVISVDDHLVEPRHLFEGRVPAAMADRAPYVKTTSKDREIWVFDGQAYPQVGLNAVVGRSKDESPMEPVRFDQMRRGLLGSRRPPGRHGPGRHLGVGELPEPDHRFLRHGLLAVLRSRPGPGLRAGVERLVLRGVVVAAPRALRAHGHHLPGRSRVWPRPRSGATRRGASGPSACPSSRTDSATRPCTRDGGIRCSRRASTPAPSCACTSGSSGMMIEQALDGPLVEMAATLFSSLSLTACVDWLWSGVPLRYPDLRIAMSEGGIGWVPMLADRLDYVHGWSGHGRQAWPSTELTPTEVLLRNFWFCSLDDPSIWPIRDRIGVDHIMVEVDYPHADSTWPDTQDFLADALVGSAGRRPAPRLPCQRGRAVPTIRCPTARCRAPQGCDGAHPQSTATAASGRATARSTPSRPSSSTTSSRPSWSQARPRAPSTRQATSARRPRAAP